MGRSEVSTSVVKWSDGLCNRVFIIIIIGRYTDHRMLYFLFHILWFYCVSLYTVYHMVVYFVCFCLILYIMYSYFYVYVFLFLCMFRSRYSVSLCCSVYCLCVSVYCTAATGCLPNFSRPICHKPHVLTLPLNNTRTNSGVNENSNSTRSVRKVSDRIFLCEHLMDYNLARLHEPILNLNAHA